MRNFLKAAALAVVVLPAAASAQFTIGLRGAYGIPGGDAFNELNSTQLGTGKQAMQDIESSIIPLQVDAAFHLTKNFSLGAYYSYGFPQLKSSFTSGFSSTSSSDQRVGIQAFWSFAPGQPIDLWIGAASGWEWFQFSATSGAGKTTAKLNGWEYITAQAGVDFNFGKLAIGPFASYGWGEFSKYDLSIAGLGSLSGTIESKATHGLFQLGGRIAFNL